MCRARIRVPDQWYGDFLAGLGAARIGERRLKEFCGKYGKETVKNFIAAWFQYSEQRMILGIRKLPKGRLIQHGQSDPIEGILPDGLRIKATIDVDPGEERSRSICATIRIASMWTECFGGFSH